MQHRPHPSISPLGLTLALIGVLVLATADALLLTTNTALRCCRASTARSPTLHHHLPLVPFVFPGAAVAFVAVAVVAVVAVVNNTIILHKCRHQRSRARRSWGRQQRRHGG